MTLTELRRTTAQVEEYPNRTTCPQQKICPFWISGQKETTDDVES